MDAAPDAKRDARVEPLTAKSGAVVVAGRRDTETSSDGDALPKTTVLGLGGPNEYGASAGHSEGRREELPKTTMLGLGAEAAAAMESEGAVSGEVERPVRASQSPGSAALRGGTMVGLGPLSRPPESPRASEPPPLPEGAEFCGDFRVVRVIARGGMGTVYEAVQLSTGRRRALKVLHRRFAPDDPNSQRFLEEARVKSRVDSEHMVDVVVAGVDHASGSLWIAMELLEGETLADRLLGLPPGAVPPADESWRVLGQLCRGLARAHQQGVVHRDLKPANVFLARGANGPETVKLLDFGIAHIMGSDAGDAAPLGTPLWMAPEQVTRGEITPATDVWAVGLIAFRLFTGCQYWLHAGNTPLSLQALLDEITTEPLVSATARAVAHGFAGDLPDGFDAWFARCVARDPASRHRSAREMAAALAEIMPAASSMPVLDYLAAPPSPRPSKRARVVTQAVPAARSSAPSAPSAHVTPAAGRPPASRSTPPSATRSAPPAASSSSSPPVASPELVLARPSSRPEPRRVVDDLEEAPTVRVRPLSPHHDDPPRAQPPPSQSPPPRRENPSRPVPPAPSRMAPHPPRASAPPRDLKRTVAAVTVAFLLGGVTAYAVHVITTPDTVSVVDAGPSATGEPGATALSGPPVWLAGATRAWGGSFAAESGAWSFVLVLQIDGEATVAGQIVWTATRVPGAATGERVTEQVTGTYEPTLGHLELTGTRSTNNVLFPVRTYRLQVTPEGGVQGSDARSESERLVGSPVVLPRAR
ncbi:MAG: protein kinase [Polyangiales bacterium]